MSKEIKSIRESVTKLLQHLESYETVAETGEPLDDTFVLMALSPAAMTHCRLEHQLAEIGYDGSVMSFPTGPLDQRVMAGLQLIYSTIRPLRHSGEWCEPMLESAYYDFMQTGKGRSFKAEIIKLKEAVKMLPDESSVGVSPAERNKRGRRRRDETPAQTKIIGALNVMLSKRGRDDPPTGKELVKASKVKNVSRFIREHFKSQAVFEAAWKRGEIAPKLATIELVPEYHREYDDSRSAD